MIATLGERGKGLGKATCFGLRGAVSGRHGRFVFFFMGAPLPACGGFRFGAGFNPMLPLAEIWIDKARFGEQVGGRHNMFV
jgi:hypothetical protein